MYTVHIDRVCMCVQPCPTHQGHMDCNLPGSSVHGISQVRILEWVVPGDFLLQGKRKLSNPGTKPVSPVSPALQVDSLLLNH